MVLSDKYAGSPPPSSLVKKTVIYVLSFGFGALLLVGIMSFVLVSIAEGILPQPKDKSASGARGGKPAPKIIGGPKKPRLPTSKAGKARDNDAPDEASDQEL